ncbi:DUF3592 domain-containing protein [Mycobacterium sp. 852014-52144_SCH5372336]|uniref:DUF3592 domain-containing protein n=1 Tax=Mycobacterium sp. 852014-52144_SCH5372336 TaxID=1834115 RepID=UPI0007FC4C05|nr:DUF3592 domain-containing protein [Mycobacterium sp. 852014-52144_SCH5372336]OBB77100.1 hypothetical protein A5759_04520 [Mycobacterium sp. 852014-52144_SCH5372336]
MANYVTEIGLLIIGIFLLFRGLPGVLQLIGALGWQQVSGVMLGSGVAGYQTQAGAGRMGANVQRSVVAYQYQLNGQTFVGQRAAFGTPLGFGMGLGGIASAQASRYAPGQPVDVWVDPKNPMNSVLRRSAPSSLVMTALGVAVLITAAISLMS